MAYKAKSITSKASSACKMNMGLVLGAADVAGSKKFVDQGEGMAEKFSGGGGGAAESKGAALDKKDKKDEEEKTKKGQADAAIGVDPKETQKV